MNKTLLAIALAVASVPMTFAQAAPQTPPASGTTANSTKTPKAKKHKTKTPKKSKKTGNSLVKQSK